MFAANHEYSLKNGIQSNNKALERLETTEHAVFTRITFINSNVFVCVCVCVCVCCVVLCAHCFFFKPLFIFFLLLRMFASQICLRDVFFQSFPCFFLLQKITKHFVITQPIHDETFKSLPNYQHSDYPMSTKKANKKKSKQKHIQSSKHIQKKTEHTHTHTHTHTDRTRYFDKATHNEIYPCL